MRLNKLPFWNLGSSFHSFDLFGRFKHQKQRDDWSRLDLPISKVVILTCLPLLGAQIAKITGTLNLMNEKAKERIERIEGMIRYDRI